ncbi:MAG TPA: NAD(+)/NADH kinase [Actinomycetota bacterium]
MRRVGFVIHPARPAALDAATGLERWLGDRDIEVRRSDGAREQGPAADAFVNGLDLVVSIGGDGTFLRAAHLASRGDVPVLGVKVGRIGFLTEAEPEQAQAVLERMFAGTARIEERLAVVAETDLPSVEPQWAMNEVIVEKGTRHRLIRLAVFVDDVYVTTFSADGVIAATPTGSTAYSFSAGGPILTPSLRSFVVTPIAAHMVFDRSLVLGEHQRVTVEVLGEEAGLLSADGRESLELPVGTRVRIGPASMPARFLRPDDAPAFFQLVRDKFGLPGSGGDGEGVR